MWPFGRHIDLGSSGLMRGFTDWHSHILPGVDDGVQTVEESLALLRLYEDLGVADVWLTPHIMEDIPNTVTHLRKRFAELRTAYSGSVRLHLAAENMLDALFEERLSSGDLLPLGDGGDHLLVETSYFSPPVGFDGILKRIGSKGYYPVLAHPERYVYMGEADYDRLRRMGVRFQLNLPSLSGLYGPEVKDKAEWLLESGYYQFIGTDTHRLHVLEEMLTRKLPKSMIRRVADLV